MPDRQPLVRGRTMSLWGRPPSRYYSYIRRLEEQVRGRKPSLAVLGCADGKFVLPAARRGFRVLAVDVDEVALFGGPKADGIGGPVRMAGLSARLEAEGLSALVEVVLGDLTEGIYPRSYDGVLSSGAIQYSRNMPRDAKYLVTAVIGYAKPGGLVYIDYMLPYETKYIGRPNCPPAGWWRHHLNSRDDIEVLYNRVMRPTLDRAHVEYPVDHYHQWGHALLRKASTER